MNEAESSQLNTDTVVCVSDVIREGSIVWVKSSNLHINCGRVEKVYPEKNEALILNFDVWSEWLVTFDNIVRVGINRFGDDYQQWMSRGL